MKKITASILSVLMMLSMVFSSSVFAANEQPSAWESFVGLFSTQATAATTGVEYRGHIQNIGNYPTDGTWVQGPTQLGTVGKSLRLEGFWIQLTNKPANVNIQYRVHVQNVGWMAPVQNGNFAGTEGKSQRIEAIEITLVNDQGNAVTGYSVQYKGHIQDQGDTAWFTNGQQLGTTGLNRRLEALEVKIVQTQADMTAYDAIVVKANAADEDLFTTASYAALTKALADNVVTAANTQAEVDAATTAITTAFDALVLGADMDAYDAAVLKAGTAKEADYTAASFAALTKALADNVVTKDDTQAEVDAATVAITAAYDALVTVPKVTGATAMNTSAEIVALDGATNIIADKDKAIKVSFSDKLGTKDQVENRTFFKIYEGTALVSIDKPVLNTDGKSISINPTSNLKDNTAYKLVVSKDVPLADGKALTADTTYTFTTGDSAYIVAIDASGTAISQVTDQPTNLATNVVENGDTITVEFNKGIETTSLTTSTVKLYDVTTGTPAQKAITVAAANVTATITIAETDGLETGHKYKVVIDGAKALLGKTVLKDEFAFTVGAQQITARLVGPDRNTTLTATDVVWPKVAAGSLDGQTIIQNGAKFYVAFNQTQALNPSTINNDTVYLQEVDVNGVVVSTVAANVTYDAAYRMASVTPQADLKSNTSYKLVVKHGEQGIKDELGLVLAGGTTDQTVTFKTYDIEAPTVTTVDLKVGGAAKAVVENGVTGIDNTKELTFSVNFSEAIGSAAKNDIPGSYAAIAPAGGNAAKFLANTGVILVNAADNTDFINLTGAGVVALSADSKTINVKVPANTLITGKTYKLMIAGKDGNPAGSVVNCTVPTDRTNAPNNVNALKSSFAFAFSTKDADDQGPKVEKLYTGTDSTISGYTTKNTEVTTGATNVDASKNLYVVFNERITTANVDGASNSTNGNVLLQQYNFVTGAWSDLNLTGANEIKFIDDTINSKSVVYIDEAVASQIPANAKLRVKIIAAPSAGNTVTDTSTNEMAADWTSPEFTTGEGPVLTSTDAAQGDTTLVNAVPAGSATIALTSNTGFAANEYVGIVADDGTVMIRELTNLTTVDTALDKAASAGNRIFTVPNATKYQTTVDPRNPIVVQVTGNDATNDNGTGAVDLSTITASTVVLKDASGTAVAATVSAVRIGANDDNAAVIITPAATLSSNTNYSVAITDGVKDGMGNKATVSNYSFKTNSPNIAPKTITINPADGSVGFVVTENVVVTLDQPITNIDANYKTTAGVAVNTATVTDATTNPIAFGTAAGVAVPAKVTLSSDGKTITINPTATLAANTEYVVKIAAEVGNVAGNVGSIAPTGDKSWSFFTSNVRPAEFSATGEFNGSDVFNQLATSKTSTPTVTDNSFDLAVVFDENNITKTDATITLLNVTSGDATDILSTSVTSANAGTDNTIRVNPTLALISGNTYKLTLSGIKDLDGNVSADVSVYFVGGVTQAAGITGTYAETVPGVTAQAAIWQSGVVDTNASSTASTVTFKGSVVTIDAEAGAPVPLNVTSGTAASITLDATGLTKEAQIDALVAAFNGMKAFAGVSAIEDFTFAKVGTGDTAYMTVTGTLAQGAANNAETLVVAGGGTLVLHNSGTAATVAPNTAGATADQEEFTYTITSPATTAGNFTIAVMEDAASVGTITVPAATTDSTATIAARISAAGVAGYTTTVTGAEVTFVRTAPGAVTTNVLIP